MALTKEEIRNGWTEEKLAAYHKEREAQKMAHAAGDKTKKVKVESSAGFNPHLWRL